MGVSIFSILMTILWSSILIIIFYFLRTKTRLLHICSISTVILLYLFCAIRLVFPVEMPWVHVVPGGALYNGIHGLFTYKIGFIRVYELLFIVWMIGMLYNLSRYLKQYHKAMSYFQKLPQAESKEGQEVLKGLDKRGRIKVLKSTAMKTPCCIGILRKRIYLPMKSYDRKELQYILTHEYTHLARNDILLKLLVRILCGIYWWNPLVYLLKKDLNQSMEIRCDLSVAGHLKESERADYLDVMLETFCGDKPLDEFAGAAGLVEEHSKSLLERFQIVADMGVTQVKRVNVFAGVMMFLALFLSYSFMLQSEYETPLSEIETGENIYSIDAEMSYITKQGDAYILHTADIEVVIEKKVAMWLMEEGIECKEVSE